MWFPVALLISSLERRWLHWESYKFICATNINNKNTYDSSAREYIINFVHTIQSKIKTHQKSKIKKGFSLVQSRMQTSN